MESLENQARSWAAQFDFAVVGDCVHLAGGEPKWSTDGQPVDSDAFFNSDHRRNFRFLTALESFVNHQHPRPPALAKTRDRRTYARRYIEMCAAQLQKVADEALPHHPVCVIAERYNEVITAVTVRPGNTPDPQKLGLRLHAGEESRYEAAVAAGTYLVEPVVDDLMDCTLHDPCFDVSVAASESLIEIASARTMSRMREIWTDHPEMHEHIVRMAGMVLAIRGDVQTLLRGMRTDRLLDPTVWTDITMELPQDKAILPLIQALLPQATADADLRWAVADALASLGEAGFEYAASLVQSTDASARQLGCQALYPPDAAPYRQLLEERMQADESRDVCYAAFASLELMACPESFDILTRAMADSTLFFDGQSMAEGGIPTFIRFNPQIDIRPMLGLFASPDPAIRTRVLESLEEIQSGEQRLDAKPIVEKALEDDNPEIRKGAIWVASILNYTDLRDTIQQIAWTDTDETVRDEAEQAIAEWPI